MFAGFTVVFLYRGLDYCGVVYPVFYCDLVVSTLIFIESDRNRKAFRPVVSRGRSQGAEDVAHEGSRRLLPIVWRRCPPRRKFFCLFGKCNLISLQHGSHDGGALLVCVGGIVVAQGPGGREKGNNSGDGDIDTVNDGSPQKKDATVTAAAPPSTQEKQQVESTPRSPTGGTVPSATPSTQDKQTGSTTATSPTTEVTKIAAVSGTAAAKVRCPVRGAVYLKRPMLVDTQQRYGQS